MKVAGNLAGDIWRNTGEGGVQVLEQDYLSGKVKQYFKSI